MLNLNTETIKNWLFEEYKTIMKNNEITDIGIRFSYDLAYDNSPKKGEITILNEEAFQITSIRFYYKGECIKRECNRITRDIRNDLSNPLYIMIFDLFNKYKDRYLLDRTEVEVRGNVGIDLEKEQLRVDLVYEVLNKYRVYEDLELEKFS